jgi:hypothetical protein
VYHRVLHTKKNVIVTGKIRMLLYLDGSFVAGDGSSNFVLQVTHDSTSRSSDGACRWGKTLIHKFFTAPEFDVGVEFSPEGEPFLHLTRLEGWAPSIYKKLILTIIHTRNALWDLGYGMVYVLVPDNPKQIKFEELLGFIELARQDNMVLMGQETK